MKSSNKLGQVRKQTSPSSVLGFSALLCEKQSTSCLKYSILKYVQWQRAAAMRKFPLFTEIQPVMHLKPGPCLSSPLRLLKYFLNQGTAQAPGNLSSAPRFLTCLSEAARMRHDVSLHLPSDSLSCDKGQAL